MGSCPRFRRHKRGRLILVVTLCTRNRYPAHTGGRPSAANFTKRQQVTHNRSQENILICTVPTHKLIIQPPSPCRRVSPTLSPLFVTRGESSDHWHTVSKACTNLRARGEKVLLPPGLCSIANCEKKPGAKIDRKKPTELVYLIEKRRELSGPREPGPPTRLDPRL
jgi:hypothetical protein